MGYGIDQTCANDQADLDLRSSHKRRADFTTNELFICVDFTVNQIFAGVNFTVSRLFKAY